MKENILNKNEAIKDPSFKKNKISNRKSFQQRLEEISDSIIQRMGSNASLIAHTILFTGSFIFILFGFNVTDVLLVLTTAVSLEAIYLAIFIQMSVNKNTKSLKEVEKDIDEIQEDVEEIQEDIDEIQEDVEEIEKDVDSIEKDVDELQEDVEEIHENIQEDEKEESEEEKREKERDARIMRVQGSLGLIQRQLDILVEEMRKEKNEQHPNK